MTSSPDETDPTAEDDDSSRLERAFSAFMRFEGDAEDPAVREAFLAGHEELRDLLGPMLSGDDEPALTSPPSPEDQSSGAGAIARAGSSLVERGAEAFVRGRVLDDQFRLLREIGAGGMGVVWEARQIALDRRVAVKVLSASMAFSPRAIARFRRESMVMAKLDHPGIARVLAVGQEQEALWFAMEYVDGGALDEQITAAVFEGQGGVRRAVTIAHRIALALDHAHAAGVVHRDVKPANVLMRGHDAPVLTDFGLAHERLLPSMTMTGAFAGTPQYVSPEQVEGRDIDARSDVFSLGASLYECLTGRPPFDAPVVHEILRNIQTKDPADPRRVRDGISADLAAVLDKALEKDPRRRYADARAFATDLGAILDGLPVRARPIGATTRLWRSARREPVKAGLIAAVFCAIPIVTGLAGYVFAKRDEIETGERTLEAERYERRLAEGMSAQANAAQSDAAVALFRSASTLAEDPVEAVALLAVTHAKAGELDAVRAVRDEFSVMWQRESVFRRVDDYLERARYRILGPDHVETPGARSEVSQPESALDFLLEGMLRSSGVSFEVSTSEAKLVYELYQEAVHRSDRARLFLHLAWLRASGPLGDESVVRRAVATVETLWPEEPASAGAIAFALSFCDPAAAIPYFETQLRTEGDRARVMTNLGICHRKSGAEEKAEAWFQRACAIEPAHAESCAIYAEFMLTRGRQEPAKALLDRALLAFADHPRLHAGMAFFHQREGDLESALAATEKSIAADPQNAKQQYHAGIFKMQMGRASDAIPNLQKAAELAPSWYLPWMNLGTCHRMGRDFEAAAAAFESGLVPSNPKLAYSRLQLGRAQARFDLEAAQRTLLQAKLEAVDERVRADIAWNLGLTYADAGDEDGAFGAFSELLELDPARTTAFAKSASNNLGMASRDARVLGMARAVIEHVDAGARWAHDALVTVYARSGDASKLHAERLRWVGVAPDDISGWLDLAEHLMAESAAGKDPSRYVLAAKHALESADACLERAGVEATDRHQKLRKALRDGE